MHALRETSPLVALMSGSGATIFAVYGDDESAMRAHHRIHPVHGDGHVHLTSTLSSFPAIRSG